LCDSFSTDTLSDRQTWSGITADELRVIAMHLAAERGWILRVGRWRVVVPVPFNTFRLHLSIPKPSPESDDFEAAKVIAKDIWALRRSASRRDGAARPTG
jgi:hypothetical protein